MKRAACLFLCLLMLFCSACKEEKNINGEGFKSAMQEDSFYSYADDNTLYNIFVKIEANTQDKTAPVTSLETKICNDTDYILQFNFDLNAFYEWEKWEDGKWKTYDRSDGTDKSDIVLDRAPLYPGPHYIMPHSAHTRTDDFSGHPLEAGLYRLRIEYKLTNETKKFADGFHLTPGVLCVAEAYLTILPAPTE